MRTTLMFILGILFASTAMAMSASPLMGQAGVNKSAAMHNQAGIQALNSGKTADAVNHFREAIKIAPDFARAHFNLGLALHDEKKQAEAATEFKKAWDLDPGDTQIVDSGILNKYVSNP